MIEILIGATLSASLVFILFLSFYFKRKKMNLRNNPKIDYKSNKCKYIKVKVTYSFTDDLS